MIGTLLNVSSILAGGAAGLRGWGAPSLVKQRNARTILGACTVYYGLRLTLASFTGSWGQNLKQLGIVVAAMVAGKIAGGLAGLQSRSNQIGQRVRQLVPSDGPPPDRPRLGESFRVCAALFCAAPLGLIGALEEGLSDYCQPLAIKAVMDGLAALTLAPALGTGVLWAALPVLATQGTVTLLGATFLRPFLLEHQLLAPVETTAGLLVFCVALVILGLRKISLTDYLPSLVFAPLLAWLL